MPPKGVKLARFDRESSIEHTPEYDEFIEKLEEYHKNRGYVRDVQLVYHRLINAQDNF